MRRPLVAASILALSLSAVAQEHQHPAGGPERLGTVNFRTSCSAAAQPQFNRGVALLHSFQFGSAITAFEGILKTDPKCGMADWGIALAEWSNPFAAGLRPGAQLQSGRDAAARARKIGAASERERAYIDAVARLYEDFENTSQPARVRSYTEAMAQVAARFPDDSESQIFYALALAASADPADKTYANQLKAGTMLEKIFAQQPDHPGLAHYIIHAYDFPPLAGKAVNAARRYSRIAPSAPHALHMPSHTFTRVGYWDESIETNIAAAEAARRENQFGEQLHATDYMTYAYLQTCRDRSAQQRVEAAPGIFARFDPNVRSSGAAPPAAAFFAAAAIPARWALERRDWAAAAKLQPRSSPFPFADAITWFARGLGAARTGNVANARAAVDALKGLKDRLDQAGEQYWALQVDIQGREIAAWTALAEKHPDEAVEQMRAAVTLEDGTEKNAMTPGPIAPARELLGEMLLELKRPEEALKQFEATLEKEPNRFRALYGAARAASLAHDSETARRHARELLKLCQHADQPARPELAEVRGMAQ